MNKKYVLIVLLLFCYTISFSQSMFEKLDKTEWEGTGSLMNSKASYSMAWASVLDAAFMRLEFENRRMDANGKEIVFKATAFYKVVEDKIEGRWFDSRGVSFPLKGEMNNNQIVIYWGDEKTEQGKTVYTLINANSIEVKDSILQNNGYIQFGEAKYNRKQ